MAETLAELSRRVDQLEIALLKLIEGARRTDIVAAAAPLQARKERREGEAEYEISTLIA